MWESGNRAICVLAIADRQGILQSQIGDRQLPFDC